VLRPQGKGATGQERAGKILLFLKKKKQKDFHPFGPRVR
jgi:hypothetical protein